ncbi:MAG: septum formation protein Maf [Ectothiorhodospiraceae bacterium]|nr:septum formation protein Maf [Ectothiorhodospiraceae bacterium]
MTRTPPPLILASGSRYRRALLDRLRIPYQVDAPDIDEQRNDGEPPQDYVRRLAHEKALAVAGRHPGALVIGSDQAAELDGRVLGKPGTRELAHAQLMAASGRTVRFVTGLCVLDTRDGGTRLDVIPFEVRFRVLDAPTVQRYLDKEPALDAAGSFHAEGLGISLFSAMHGEDPTALIGLPLIRLAAFLRASGVPVP